MNIFHNYFFIQFFGIFIFLKLGVTKPIDFVDQIKPFLEKKCLACHNPNVTKGKVDFSSAKSVFGSKKELVIPGDAYASEIWLASTSDDPNEPPYMPDEGEHLTKEEADLLARWIDEGAKWPEGLVLREASKADKSWWAYQPLTKSGHSKIDTFIDEKLTEANLRRNPPAKKRDLIRRATYDLTGLPPTPEQVEAFVTDQDPKAFEKLIDRLLASPRYAERWGRHWLDVVRFGESNGFERNFMINDLWPFRDYVIDSINQDKPFDQLIREHIAGDIIEPNNLDKVIGSAFLVAGPYDDVNNQDSDAKAQIRANTLDEIINATGEAFLGMTISCARCHDHKFDPIAQEDYYQMYATFSGVRHGSVPFVTDKDKKEYSKKRNPLEDKKRIARDSVIRLDEEVLKRAISDEFRNQHEKSWIRPAVDRRGTEERFEPVEAKFVRLVCEASDVNPHEKGFKIDEFEVWSSGENPLNLALQQNGGIASGSGRDSFYGPKLANDGIYGERFFSSGKLIIELEEPSLINRVFFSSARIEKAHEHRNFEFVAEYFIEISLDGKEWLEVANGKDRKPRSSKLNGFSKRWELIPKQLSHLEFRLRSFAYSNEEKKLRQKLEKEYWETHKQIREIPPTPTAWIGKRVASDAKGPFHLFIGGSPKRKGTEVRPASLSTLSDVLPGYQLESNSSESERRRELAEWITHPSNPLTPRVLANRLWHYHFSTGIVDTPNDLGYMGGRPTHPELLDFLASKLVENDWKLKPMHRLIMLSETYRQSSAHRKGPSKVDGDSRLLWRFPPRRLSAEEIRDTLLFVSGKLKLTNSRGRRLGGKGFRLYKHIQDNVSTYHPLDEHGPETYRRAVYHQNARAAVVDLMTEYDQPDCSLSAPRRARTTTPLQALTMLNHSFTLDMAKALATRISGQSPAEQSENLYQLAYQRLPSKEESEQMAALLKQGNLEAVCRAIINSSELIYLD